MNNFFSYLLDAFLNSLWQLLILFGPLIFLALIMNQFSKRNEIYSIRLMGMKSYLYIFGWLGTAVHETGHAVFALVFGHRIREVKLFTFNPNDQKLGYVNHEYNPGSIYQQTGNFFIGIGPVLFGSLVLFLFSYLLFHFRINNSQELIITTETFKSFASVKILFSGVVNNLNEFTSMLFNNISENWWKIIIFIYLGFSIGGSITLSKADISSSVKGFIYIAVFFLIINLLTLWLGNFINRFINFISPWMAYLYVLLIITIGINAIFFIILWAASRLKRDQRPEYY